MNRPVPVSKRTAMILMLSLFALVVSACSSEPTRAPIRFRQVTPIATTPSTPGPTPDISATISAAFAAAQPPKSQASVVPDDVSYSVIQADIISGIRKSIDVRLTQKVSEATLRAIALELKAGDSRTYDRTFIVYYLPDMPVGAGGWATTHFDPGLEVRILGLASEEERVEAGGDTSFTREDIGSWLDERSGSQIVMYRDRGIPYVEQYFSDGSVLKEELVVMASQFGQGFHSKGGSSLSGHWVIDRTGALQIRDTVGLISKANPIN